MNLAEASQFMLSCNWGKWPRMFVSGEVIPPALALEVIRRTDSFFAYPFGNNRQYVDKWRAKLLMWASYDACISFNDYHRGIETWKDKWKFIELAYVHNDWVSSCSIYGPHGWANPDGTIYQLTSIGKWPTLDEVHFEWKTIAEEFAFLKLSITFFSEKYDNSESQNQDPLISLKIEHGKLNWIEPDLSIHSDEALIKLKAGRKLISDMRMENALSDEIMESWAKHAKKLFR